MGHCKLLPGRCSAEWAPLGFGQAVENGLQVGLDQAALLPGADLDPVAAGTLCDQFERAASLLVGPGRARTLADTLRRTAAELYGS